MQTILIAIGNTLRGDDGVGHRVLEILGDLPGVVTRAVHQLTPENAEEISGAERVFFIDADVRPGKPAIEDLGDAPPVQTSCGHTVMPAEIVALSRSLFDFRGTAFVMSVPGEDFSHREALSGLAEENAEEAAGILRRKLRSISAG